LSYIKKSKTDIYITPDRVFELIEKNYNLTKSQLFDPCPLNPKLNGLLIDWKLYNYVNPPYTLLNDFVQKSIRESLKGNSTIMLLPSKTDQKWFHDLKSFHSTIVWIRKRLVFKGEKSNSPQPHFLIFIYK
jgi:hypothetical protein